MSLVEQYWTEKEQPLKCALQALRENIKAKTTADEWPVLTEQLSRVLPRILATTVSDVKRQMLSKLQFGIFTLHGAARLSQDLLGRGLLRIAVYVGPSKNTQLPHLVWMLPPRPGEQVTQRCYSRLDKSRLGQAMLTLDIQDATDTPLCVIHPSRAGQPDAWTIYNDCCYTRGERTWNTGALYPASLARNAAQLKPLMERFEMLAEKEKERCQLQTQIAQVERRLEQLACFRHGWDQIHLPDEQLLEIIKQVELFADNDPAKPAGILLKGAPGTGKTMLAQTIGKILGCNFTMVSLVDLKPPHIGEGPQRVRALWQQARENGPSVIFIDECESVFGKRGAAETDVLATDTLQAFLAEWTGKDKNVLLIGATNRRDMLDEAIVSRFGLELEIALPDEQSRDKIIRRELKAVGFAGEVPVNIGKLTQGMSGRDLHQIAKKVRSLAYPQMPTPKHFEAAVAAYRGAGSTQVDLQARWDTLVLDKGTLAKLRTTCCLLQDAEAWRKRGVTIPSGMLLTGPPGTGKTQTARTMANEAGLAFIAVSSADLKANFLGQSGNRVKNVFERARSSAPAILFVDELDIVAPRRGSNANDSLTKEIVGQLLQELDGIRRKQGHVFVLAATNHPELIDSAILSRFPERIHIPLPDQKCRRLLVRNMLKGKRVSFDIDSGSASLSYASEGMSGRDLVNWLARAEQKAVMRAVAKGGPEHFSLALNDFEPTEISLGHCHTISEPESNAYRAV